MSRRVVVGDVLFPAAALTWPILLVGVVQRGCGRGSSPAPRRCASS
jgi:hypothetical protein